MDIELYYQEIGHGEPFIFLHGNGENGFYFQNQIDYFQSKYRVMPWTPEATANLREAMRRLPSNSFPMTYMIS